MNPVSTRIRPLALWFVSLTVGSVAACGGKGEGARNVVDERPLFTPRPVCRDPLAVPPALAGPGGGYVAATVPRGREIKPGLHGLTIVYGREEPPPHAAVDFTQISCTVRIDGEHRASNPRCKATPGGRHDHATPEGSWHAVADEAATRVRTCFAAKNRPPSRADLALVENFASPWKPTDGNARILLVRTAQIASVPRTESYGCEGAHDQPCDRATRPTGGMMDAIQHMDVALYALDRQGIHLLRGAFAPSRVELPLLYFVVEKKGAYGDRVVAPELEVGDYHPLDANYSTYEGAPSRIVCYYPALAARLAALAVDSSDRAAQIAVLYDRTLLAFLERDAAGGRARLAELHAALEVAPGDPSASAEVRSFVVQRVAVLDQLAAGTLSVDDPCDPAVDH